MEIRFNDKLKKIDISEKKLIHQSSNTNGTQQLNLQQKSKVVKNLSSTIQQQQSQNIQSDLVTSKAKSKQIKVKIIKNIDFIERRHKRELNFYKSGENTAENIEQQNQQETQQDSNQQPLSSSPINIPSQSRSPLKKFQKTKKKNKPEQFEEDFKQIKSIINTQGQDQSQTISLKEKTKIHFLDLNKSFAFLSKFNQNQDRNNKQTNNSQFLDTQYYSQQNQNQREQKNKRKTVLGPKLLQKSQQQNPIQYSPVQCESPISIFVRQIDKYRKSKQNKSKVKDNNNLTHQDQKSLIMSQSNILDDKQSKQNKEQPINWLSKQKCSQQSVQTKNNQQYSQICLQESFQEQLGQPIQKELNKSFNSYLSKSKQDLERNDSSKKFPDINENRSKSPFMRKQRREKSSIQIKDMSQSILGIPNSRLKETKKKKISKTFKNLQMDKIQKLEENQSQFPQNNLQVINNSSYITKRLDTKQSTEYNTESEEEKIADKSFAQILEKNDKQKKVKSSHRKYLSVMDSQQQLLNLYQMMQQNEFKQQEVNEDNQQELNKKSKTLILRSQNRSKMTVKEVTNPITSPLKKQFKKKPLEFTRLDYSQGNQLNQSFSIFRGVESTLSNGKQKSERRYSQDQNIKNAQFFAHFKQFFSQIFQNQFKSKKSSNSIQQKTNASSQNQAYLQEDLMGLQEVDKDIQEEESSQP